VPQDPNFHDFATAMFTLYQVTSVHLICTSRTSLTWRLRRRHFHARRGDPLTPELHPIENGGGIVDDFDTAIASPCSRSTHQVYPLT
jgi:hypothetical protein